MSDALIRIRSTEGTLEMDGWMDGELVYTRVEVKLILPVQGRDATRSDLVVV